MLLYLYSRLFPGKTFVILSEVDDTLARVRASFMHVLHETGFGGLHFRLRYNKQFLKNSSRLSEYGIRQRDTPSIEIVPVGKLDNPDFSSKIPETHASRQALEKESDQFAKRDQLLLHLGAIIWMLVVSIPFLLVSVYWFAGLWTLLHAYFAYTRQLSFKRAGGFVSRSRPSDLRHLRIGAALAAANTVPIFILFIMLVLRLLDHCVSDTNYPGQCTTREWFSVIVFGVTSAILVVLTVAYLRLHRNYRFQPGHLIEPTLLQADSIVSLLAMLQGTSVKERRYAALELASLAAASDSNRLAMIAHGGVSVINSTVLTNPDLTTRVYAAQVISELILFKPCLDAYLGEGGLKCLLGMLAQEDANVAAEALHAVLVIGMSGEEGRQALLDGRLFADLRALARRSDLDVQSVQNMVELILELLKDPKSSLRLASEADIVPTLLLFLKHEDYLIQSSAIASLDLVCVDNLALVLTCDAVLPALLTPNLLGEPRLQLLIVSFLKHYIKNEYALGFFMNFSASITSLQIVSKSNDVLVQSIVVDICAAILSSPRFRPIAVHRGIADLLAYLAANCKNISSLDTIHALQDKLTVN
eukprot:m.346436 g.346436  ORF g.346436 m.346436 type:complete len:588 (+) comp55833_c0_seq1:86-1849(+)